LEDLCFHIFKSYGASESESSTIARHLVKANLTGHDSHGVIQIPTYVQRIKKGYIIPGAPFEIVEETPTTAKINGNWGFGFVVTEKAMEIAIEKARKHNVAALTVYYQSHIGRLADYPLMAAEEGMIGIITADSGAGRKSVVPFGGKDVRLGTNPISISVPSNLEAPVCLDMATSIVASGKIGLAAARNEKIPLGWIIDKDGEPSTDPNELKKGGGILPLGGSKGYKGFGLSFIVETLSGMLTGLGFGSDPEVFETRHNVEHRHNDGCFITVFNVKAFRLLEDFKKEVTEFAEFIKTSSTFGDNEIFYPGEPEWLSEQKLRKEGIYIEEKTWTKLRKIILDQGLNEKIGESY
jgi:uncharacterized oxidoreductase